MVRILFGGSACKILSQFDAVSELFGYEISDSRAPCYSCDKFEEANNHFENGFGLLVLQACEPSGRNIHHSYWFGVAMRSA